MTLKTTILTAIIAILTAALCFCAGMNHAIRSMEIETDGTGNTATITLHDQVYTHDLAGRP